MRHCGVGTSSGLACENPEALGLAWSRVSHDLAAAAQTYAHSQSQCVPALRGLCRLGNTSPPTAFILVTKLETFWLCVLVLFPQECALNDERIRQKRCIKGNIYVGLGIFTKDNGASPKSL